MSKPEKPAKTSTTSQLKKELNQAQKVLQGLADSIEKHASSLSEAETAVRLFGVRSRNPISSSVISIYLWSELTYIDIKFLSARCPLADVLSSACGTPPLCHLSLTTSQGTFPILQQSPNLTER